MELGAKNGVRSAPEPVVGRGQQHAQRRRRKVDPHGPPFRCGERRPKGARGVHAHARKRRLQRDVDGDQGTGEQSGKPRQLLRVGDDQHKQHHSEGNCGLGEKRNALALRAGNGHRVVHARIRHGPAQRQRRDRNAEYASGKLRQAVEDRVPAFDLAQQEERQCQRGVHVRPRPFAPRRMDDRDQGQAHGKPAQRMPRERIGNRLTHRRGRVFEQHAERASREHEETERRGLHQVLRPVGGKSLRGGAGNSLPAFGSAVRLRCDGSHCSRSQSG